MRLLRGCGGRTHGGGLRKFGCGERTVGKMERESVEVRFFHAEFVDELKGRYTRRTMKYLFIYSVIQLGATLYLVYKISRK